jgi:transcriptional regulator with XRE-family HTH domain
MNNQDVPVLVFDNEGFRARLTQAIKNSGLNQTEFARQLNTSPGFVSDLVRGEKKPGIDFLLAIKARFGISPDWLLTGDGSLSGAATIDMSVMGLIRLQVSVVRCATLDQNPTAKALLLLLRDGREAEILADKGFRKLVEALQPEAADTDLAMHLYNSHIQIADAAMRRQLVLAGAISHFESRKPADKLATLAGTTQSVRGSIQVNTGKHQKVAGRDYHEHKDR